jgi:beta-glucuronidase
MADQIKGGVGGVTRRGAVGAAGFALAAVAADAAQAAVSKPASGGSPGLLYPHESASRATRALGGTWRFKTDPADVGEGQGWANGLSDFRLIPVPSSWNDIFDDVRNYVGSAWYETEFRIEKGWRGQRIHLRFGSVNYTAKVWLNGRLVGDHVGGHLPFAFDVTDKISLEGENRLTVLVENKIRLDRVPAVPDLSKVHMHTIHFPQTAYDFFPYAGIHRPVLLFTTPDVHLADVTVRTSLDGKVSVELVVNSAWSGTASVVVADDKGEARANIVLKGGRGSGVVSVAAPRPWSPEDPHLYRLTVRLADDEYVLKIGIRTVTVRGDALLLNGKPVFLRGFGKHEDFPIHGRGLDVPSIVRDFELLKWIGANSFRTSHYPYSEEAMMLADEYGLLVIDETPAVSMVFMDPPEIIEARRRQLASDMEALVRRDKNNPCVIMWSLANEPLVKPFHTTDPEPRGRQRDRPAVLRPAVRPDPPAGPHSAGDHRQRPGRFDRLAGLGRRGLHQLLPGLVLAVGPAGPGRGGAEERRRQAASPPSRQADHVHGVRRRRRGRHARPAARDVDRGIPGRHGRDVYPGAGRLSVHLRHAPLGLRRFPDLAEHHADRGAEPQRLLHPRAKPKLAPIAPARCGANHLRVEMNGAFSKEPPRRRSPDD